MKSISTKGLIKKSCLDEFMDFTPEGIKKFARGCGRFEMFEQIGDISVEASFGNDVNLNFPPRKCSRCGDEVFQSGDGFCAASGRCEVRAGFFIDLWS